MKGWAIGTAVVGVLAAGIAAVLHYQAKYMDRDNCTGNLHFIGLDMLQYTKDNSGQFPDSLQTLFIYGDTSPAGYVCPASNDTPATGPTTRAIANNLVAGGHLSYIYVGNGASALKR